MQGDRAPPSLFPMPPEAWLAPLQAQDFRPAWDAYSALSAFPPPGAPDGRPWKDKCADLVKAWRDHLNGVVAEFEDLQLADDVERPGLAFRSTQVHERIGAAGPRYNVRHIGISLYRPASAC
jgi:hypothetical protein